MIEASFKIEPALDKTKEVSLEGWKSPMKIKYSSEQFAGVSFLCWKIENTEQVFRIPTKTVYEKHGINYADHFLMTLAIFREDYLDWKAAGFPEDWMKRYERIFENYIT